MRKNAAAAEAILPRLAIHTELAARVLIGFVRDTVAKAGLARCVVGLSGGIDSALAATVAARALGPANVLAVRLPAAESSAASL